VIIKRCINDEDFPWDLLLLADPNKERVDEYVKRGECYVANEGEDVVGTYTLLFHHDNSVEIINIAVRNNMQGKGIGKTLVLDIIERCKRREVHLLEVGTGNSSIDQLAFYQKCGFRITGVEKDLFTNEYSEPIEENGIRCRDMIRLSMHLQNDTVCKSQIERK